jgi:hypothetical protein
MSVYGRFSNALSQMRNHTGDGSSVFDDLQQSVTTNGSLRLPKSAAHDVLVRV